MRPARLAAAAFLAASVFPGCGYTRDRLRDFSDPWVLGVEGLCVPLNVSAQAGTFHAGVGMVWLDSEWSGERPLEPGGFGAGFAGRKGFCAWRPYEANLLFYGEKRSPAAPQETHYALFQDARVWKALGAEFLLPEAPGYYRWDPHAAGLEASAGFLLGARAGANPLEVLDFLLGLAALDIAGDDERPWREAPPAPLPIEIGWRAAGPAIEYLWNGRPIGAGEAGRREVRGRLRWLPGGTAVRIGPAPGGTAPPDPSVLEWLRGEAVSRGLRARVAGGEPAAPGGQR